MSFESEPQPGKPRVVFDCVLFLQAIGKGGNHAYGCLQLAINGEIDLCMSEACISEIDEVLRRPLLKEAFPMLDDATVDGLIAWLQEFAIIVDPVPHVFDLPADPKDEPYIDLAIAAGAELIVSWDKHLKNLADPKHPDGKRFMEQFPKIRVSDPKAFLAAYRVQLGKI